MRMSQRPQPTGISQWSYSRWQVYETCPKRAYFKFVKKMPEPGGEALERGAEIHGEAEAFLRKPGKVVPHSLKLVAKEVQALAKKNAQAELELAVTREWSKTGWFDQDVWARAKVDAWHMDQTGSVEVVDWKTGKHRPGDIGYTTQLELYAVFAFAVEPDAKEVQTKLVFTDHGKSEVKEFKRAQFDTLKKTWEKRTLPMLSDKVFPARPSDSACRWCTFRKSKGGPCEF